MKWAPVCLGAPCVDHAYLFRYNFLDLFDFFLLVLDIISNMVLSYKHTQTPTFSLKTQTHAHYIVFLNTNVLICYQKLSLYHIYTCRLYTIPQYG